MTLDEDETIMPMNDVTAKPMGIVNSCDQSASRGLRANLAKSGSLTLIWLVLIQSWAYSSSVTYNQCGKVCDGVHDTIDHRPAQLTSTQSPRLVHNRSDSVRSYDGPNEESNASGGDKVRLYSEEMTDLMDREPDGWQTTDPENEERGKVVGLRSTARGHRIRNGVLETLESAEPLS